MPQLLKEMCRENDISLIDLLSNARSAPNSYKVYQIPKRSGGKRTVAHPTPFVKKVQKSIFDTYLKELPISKSATAYQLGCSIVENAKVHKENSWILKLDFKNFFPSISPEALFKFLERRHKLNNLEKSILSLYLFRRCDDGNLGLSVGAPSSPFVSNLVMLDIDLKIEEISRKNNVSFTRYADDITLSGDDFNILNQCVEHIRNILHNESLPRLSLNDNKTRLIGKGRSRRVTGVILSNEGCLTVGRRKRKKIRALLHLYSCNKLNKKDIPYLHGLLSFVRSVEPDFFKKIDSKYGEKMIIKLARESFFISKENNKND